MTNTFKTSCKPLGKFLACMNVTAGLSLGAYALTVDSLIQEADIPSTYKWFLLKNVPGPRLIFESGSNTHHAIDTDAVGKAIGMTAINIADNGGYALEDKITRLETYARAGDVVVLPLEWSFYRREALTDDYAESLFTSNRDYYRSMPVGKQIKRALSLPPAIVFSEFRKKKNRSPLGKESPAKELFITALTQPTGHLSRQNSIGPGLGVVGQSCDDYVLGKADERKQLRLGSNIKPALVRLKKLRKRGIHIHFAWPILAGDGCLSDPAYVTGFRAEIEQAVTSSGFGFLNTPTQSLYGQNVQDDTPYHLTTAGTNAHTKKIISALKAQGYGNASEPLDVKSFARHRLLEVELAQITPLLQPALPFGKALAMDKAELRDYVEFSAGWWDFESYGRWMRDNRAVLRVTLPTNGAQNSVLKIQGATKTGRPERVDISVHGELVHSAMFGESVPLLVPVANMPQGRALSIYLTLPDTGIPQSPLERGESEDARSMTLHIQSLELTSLEQGNSPIVTTDTQVQNISTAKQNIAPQVNADAYAPTTAISFPNMSPISRDPAQIGNLDHCIALKGYGMQSTKKINYTQGWWPHEPTGRWMKTQQADIKLFLPTIKGQSHSGRYILRLSGDFFMGRSRIISAIIDGKKSAPLTLTDGGALVTSFETDKQGGVVDVTLQLDGEAPQSPKALGLSPDERTLTYFLKSAQLIPA